MKQVAILSSYKEFSSSARDHNILRLCKLLSGKTGLNCTVVSPADFLLTTDQTLVRHGGQLEDGELKLKTFTEPFTPDYIFFYNVSDTGNEHSLCLELLTAVAERGVPVSYDPDASLIGIKSILEERCSEFESVSGIQIPRPKTIIINGADDIPKINDFIRESGPCILKPHNSSRARGIRILEAESQVPALDLGTDRYVLQELVPDPMTIDGYKVGLRIYLLISDLRKPAYSIAAQGLVKLAIRPYQRANPESEIVGSSYAKRQGAVPVMYLLKDQVDTTGTDWTAIRGSIEKTINSFMEAIAWRAGMHYKLSPSFQFWGVDIAIQLSADGPRAWLIEVNPFPALYRKDQVTDDAVDEVLADELFTNAAGLTTP